MTKRVVRRLTLLQNEAELVPVPIRKFFHIGKPHIMEEVGECVPLISWVDGNLAQFVVSDVACNRWGKHGATFLFNFPSLEVASKDGVLLVTGRGTDESLPHPSGKGQMHFIHMGRAERLFEGAIRELYVYRLEGVQVKKLGVPE